MADPRIVCFFYYESWTHVSPGRSICQWLKSLINGDLCLLKISVYAKPHILRVGKRSPIQTNSKCQAL